MFKDLKGRYFLWEKNTPKNSERIFRKKYYEKKNILEIEHEGVEVHLNYFYSVVVEEVKVSS